MPITDIVLRQTVHADLVTTGLELTFPQGDTNWITIYEALKALTAGTGVAPYNPITGYTGTMYVSHAGNIWVHIAGGTSTGVTPGTNPAVWQLTSVGALAHQQGTDVTLAFGTSVQVAASDIWSILNEQVISITVASFMLKAAAGTLI